MLQRLLALNCTCTASSGNDLSATNESRDNTLHDDATSYKVGDTGGLQPQHDVIENNTYDTRKIFSSMDTYT